MKFILVLVVPPQYPSRGRWPHAPAGEDEDASPAIALDYARGFPCRQEPPLLLRGKLHPLLSFREDLPELKVLAVRHCDER